MIVYGANDSSSRESLLRESELTLSKAISASHTVEETHKHAREILNERGHRSAQDFKTFKILRLNHLSS